MSSRIRLIPVMLLLVIGAWLAVAAVGGQTFGRLSEVQQNSASAFLPSSAESTRAADELTQFTDTTVVPGLFVIDDASDDTVGITEAFVDEVVTAPIPDDPQGRLIGDVLVPPAQVQPPVAVPSQDGEAMLVVFNLSAEALDQNIAGESLGQLVSSQIRDSWEAQDAAADGFLTGPLGIQADLLAAFAGIDGLLLGVALAVVFVILLIVYRSPVLPVLVLATSMIALTGAVIAVYALASADAITLNGQAQGIMFILVVGATTDYALLLVARYREELLSQASPYTAMARAWRRTLEPVAASAVTVIAGLLVLLLSDLKSNAALGPVGAIGIVAAALAALTLLPALLLIAGRRSRAVFWPVIPRYQEDHSAVIDGDPADPRLKGFWVRIARAVDARPRRTWIAATAFLVLLAAFAPTFRAEGSGAGEVFVSQVDSVQGTALLEDHFDADTTSPVRVFIGEDQADQAVAAIEAVDGIESAAVYATATGDTDGGMPDTAPDAGEPLVVDGRVQVVAVTSVAATSARATDIVDNVRDAVSSLGDDVLVGGEAAEQLDTRQTTQRDTLVIIPLILVVIFLVLVALLRAVTGPVVVVLANILSYGSAIGISAVVFNVVLDLPSADPAVPLLGFVFLVALGVDYSIFLMSRAREETVVHGARAGVRRALAVTGGVITSAGLVLAATFASLAVIPLSFLVQVAVIVSLGVLIDTFVVRSLLLPGLVGDMGRTAWWPWSAKIKN